MVIQNSLPTYASECDESIQPTLQKMGRAQASLHLTSKQNGRLHAPMSDCDPCRTATTDPNLDLASQIGPIGKRAARSALIHAPAEAVHSLFSETNTVVPLVDDPRRMGAVAREGRPGLSIGTRRIGQQHPTYVIAEIGNNHQGDVNLARELIDAAVAAGADCAKFQMRMMASLYRNGSRADDAGEDLGEQYMLDLLGRFNLGPQQLFGLFDYCLRQKITPLCTPWDEESVELLDQWGMQAFKVASADLTNTPLLRNLASKRKPLLISTGMSSEVEIRGCVDLLHGAGASFALMHCNSTYPTPFKDVNLAYLPRLAALGDTVVGYSGHERGWHVPIAAVAMGARIVEKHLTLDRELEGSDHKVSLLPDEFRAMVRAIREVEEAFGAPAARQMSQGERMNRETLSKSIVAAVAIPEGSVIAGDMLGVTSPGRGLQPNRLDALVGSVARRPFAAGDFFFPSDLEAPPPQPRPYHFRRPWGVPVRYHDHRRILQRSNMPLLEYHLSYKDMKVDLPRFFDGKLPVGYIVHAPELFSGDHVLDLCSSSPAYRQRSVDELQRVIDVANALRDFHAQPQPVLVVANVGGFSEQEARPRRDRAALYDLVLESLSRIDATGCEIIPQTMPPFPWHFGGQRFHNIFMEAAEIAAFCTQNRMRVCIDISHSRLACTHLDASFREFLRLVGPHAAHLHIADASGVDGEGLQIGEGELDLTTLVRDLDAFAPQASFIPEIWQGHKNDGEGFWRALEALEAAFQQGDR